MLLKKTKRSKRHKKIRTRVKGNAKRPRLCVFKSLNHIYAQLIDDENNKTLAQASDMEIKGKKTGAFEVGKLIAEKAKKIKIERVVFDRGGFIFHGQVELLAKGAREAGLKF